MVVKALLTRTIVIHCDGIPYTFRNVPLRKIINWVIVEASIYVKPCRPWGYPTHLQIEPDTHCNLKCVVCPVTTGLGRPIGRMDFRIFKDLIDDVGDYVFLILLWDWGEPFLNLEVNDMIAYAKKEGIKLVSSTNGHVFAEEKYVDAVIRSGLDSLIIALDGASQDTYARYRQGGHVDVVIQGIRNIVNRKQALQVSHPFINIRTVVMSHNESELPQIKKLVQEIGVDALTLKTFNPYDSDESLVPKDEAYRRFRYLADGKTRARRRRNPCKHLWNMPAIHWNGYVCMCTYDAHEAYVMGDLTKVSFRKIWKGPDYRKIREQFRNDWEGIEMCTGCSYAYEGGSCIDEIMAGAFFFSAHRP